MSNSNSANFLKRAGELIKDELGKGEQIETLVGERNAIVWDACCNLICHAAINVFVNAKTGNPFYSKTIAVKFKEDVSNELGISVKQAGKYTETISAALGVRMDKSGLKGGGIKGLRVAAMDGPEEVREFCKALDEPVETLGALRRAVREEGDSEIVKLAKKLHKQGKVERDEIMSLVKKLDDAAFKAADEQDKKAAKKQAKASANQASAAA